MRKLIERLLIFIIGIPLVYALVMMLPMYKHLPLNITVILFSAAGAVEFSSMLEKKQLYFTKPEAFILGSLAPLSMTLHISFNIPQWAAYFLLTAGTGWVLISRIFTLSVDMEKVVSRIAGCFSIIIYPGLFMYWLVRMNIWENSSAVFLFLLIVFGNDSIAWLAGTLFGKNNRGLIPASLNKSIAGFIGGLLGAVIISLSAAYLFPFIFSSGTDADPVSWLLIKSVFLGLCTGIFAALGDLCESAIKRSCDFIDSGKIILGRGGILDSIDSIAIAAPVYFMFFSLFFINS
jgi:phosphatidate cytidylyltransferase